MEQEVVLVAALPFRISARPHRRFAFGVQVRTSRSLAGAAWAAARQEARVVNLKVLAAEDTNICRIA